MRELLKKALLARHPTMRPLIADRCVRSYIGAVMRQIATQLALASQDDWSAGELTFHADKVRDECGQVTVGRQRVRAWTLMQSHPSTSLVIQVYVGNSISGRASRIVFNPTYKKEIMDELRTLSIELDPVHLDALDVKANVELTVDPESLASFLKQTRRTLQQHAFGEAYERKLIRSATIANTLQSRIHARQDGSHFVKEYWERIDSGRMYGHGLSLQRIPKEAACRHPQVPRHRQVRRRTHGERACGRRRQGCVPRLHRSHQHVHGALPGQVQHDGHRRGRDRRLLCMAREADTETDVPSTREAHEEEGEPEFITTFKSSNTLEMTVTGKTGTRQIIARNESVNPPSAVSA